MQCANDVFVSYAIRDDTPKPNGWVTSFVKHLEDYLLQKIARRDIKIWMDRKRLQGNDLLTPEISQAARDSAVFLMFLSPQYHASPWCQAELSTFLQRASDHTRVFRIDLSEKARPPMSLTEQLGYKFWEYEHDGRTARLLAYPKYDKKRDRQYYVLLNMLASQMASRMEALLEPPPPVVQSQPPSLAQLLTGGWQIQVVYPNGMAGQGKVQLFGDGEFLVEGMSPIIDGPYRIEGTWQTLSPAQILLQGRQIFGNQVVPFYVTVKIFQISPTTLTGVMSTGEQLTWQRVG